MTTAVSKFNINQGFKSAGTYVNNVDVSNDNVLKLVVENADADNVIQVLGKIQGESSYHPIGSLQGNTSKIFNIQFYDQIQVICTNFSSAIGYIKLIGSSFSTSLSEAGGAALDISGLLNSSTNPSVQVVTLVDLGTEYSLTLPVSCKRFSIKDRSYSSNIKISFSQNGTASNYTTLSRGCSYSESDLNLTTSNRTIYLKADKNNVILECVIWI